MNIPARIARQMPVGTLAPVVSAAVLVLALAGCAQRPEPHAEAESRDVAKPAVAAASPATAGEVPAELLESIVDDVVKAENLQRDAIVVERAEYVIWPDGALGCPEPGVMYTQAQVPGYWVVLRAGERQFDYRASEKGQFRRCKGSFKMQLPVG